MNKYFYFIILFLLQVSVVYGKNVIVRPSEVTLENGRHYLHVQVWNCSKDNLMVLLPELPWGQNKMGIVVYSAGELAGVPLQERVPIADFPDRKVNIKPESHVEGSIDLDSRFPDLQKYRNTEDLVVFWQYDLKSITGKKSQFVGGMIPFSKTRDIESLKENNCSNKK